MDVSFDFKYEGKSFFGKVLRPIAKVSLQSPRDGRWIDAWMVVDTGADFTILPNYLTKILDLSLKTDCIVDTTRGVGGEQTIYLLKKRIIAKIGTIKRQIPLAFFGNDEVPPLMGRLGFLETFDTQFLKSHKVIFKT